MPKAQDTLTDPTPSEFQDAKRRVAGGVIAFSFGTRCRFYDEDAFLVDMMTADDEPNKLFYFDGDGYSAAQTPTRFAERLFDDLALNVNVCCVIMTRDRGEWLPVTIWQKGAIG